MAAVAALSGCGNAKGSSENTTAPANVTSTTLASKDSAVLDAYRQFWGSYLAAAHPMNPNDPALAQRATGEELSQVRNTFLSRQSSGQDIRGTIDLAPHVVT